VLLWDGANINPVLLLQVTVLVLVAIRAQSQPVPAADTPSDLWVRHQYSNNLFCAAYLTNISYPETLVHFLLTAKFP